MAGYYPSCGDVIPAHSCDPCADKEFARVRSAAFIDKSYIATIQADPTNEALWATGINDEVIFVIPETNGEVSEPSEKTGAGYGDQIETLLGYDFSAKFADPNYAENCDFWNAIKRSRNYHFVYRTSSKIHITDVTTTVIPKAPVTNDLNAEVNWSVTVKWSQPDNPCPVDTPEGVFECYVPE